MTTLVDWLLSQYPCKELTNDNGEPIDRWITCPARLAFPSLDKPTKMEGTAGEPKYQASLLFPPAADITALRSAANAAAKSKFGAAPKGSLRNPFRAQGEKQFTGFVDGAYYINTSTKFMPVILGEDKSIISATDPRVYPGVWVRAKVTCYAYDQAGNKGVAFGLVSLQRLADDEKLVVGENPEAGMDDAKLIPAHLRKVAPTANGSANDWE